MSTLTASSHPSLTPDHRRILERTVTVTRELVVEGGQMTTSITGFDRMVLRLALWLIDRRRIRGLHPAADSAEIARRVAAGRQQHIDRFHGLPL